MQTFYRVISVILHPVLLPIVGASVYLAVLPIALSVPQKYFVFFMVLGSTFVIPLITLFLLKMVGIVKTNQAETIQERKLPVLLMIFNYMFLARVLQDIWQLRELTILAYATAIGLIVTSILFYYKIKSSLHMLGIMGMLSFTLIYGENYQYANQIIALLVALAGCLATARLQLKAHTVKEIIYGSALGFFLPILLTFFL